MRRTELLRQAELELEAARANVAEVATQLASDAPRGTVRTGDVLDLTHAQIRLAEAWLHLAREGTPR